MFSLHYKLTRPVTAAIFLGAIAWATPTLAAGTDTAAQPQAHATRQAKKPVDVVDVQIADLHKKLGITAGQEAHWAQVAQVMRDNAKATAELVAAKRKNEKTMTAVEDLHAYAEIAQARADQIKKLAEAFDTLYATMPPDQQKVADTVFREHKRRLWRQRHAAQRHQS